MRELTKLKRIFKKDNNIDIVNYNNRINIIYNNVITQSKLEFIIKNLLNNNFKVISNTWSGSYIILDVIKQDKSVIKFEYSMNTVYKDYVTNLMGKDISYIFE